MCIIAAIFVVAIVCLLILIRIQDSLNLYKCTKQIERDPWTRDVNVQVTYTGHPEDRKIEQTEQNVIDDLQKQYDEARERILFNIDSVLLEEPSLAYHSFVENYPQKKVEWTSVLFSTSS